MKNKKKTSKPKKPKPVVIRRDPPDPNLMDFEGARAYRQLINGLV